VPGYEPIIIYPGETFESVFKALFPEYVYKGVFENRNEARSWIADAGNVTGYAKA
jgi:hypothetical protein